MLTANPFNCWKLSLRQPAAKPVKEGSTTIAEASRVKRSEMGGVLRDGDMVCSAQRCVAAKARMA